MIMVTMMVARATKTMAIKTTLVKTTAIKAIMAAMLTIMLEMLIMAHLMADIKTLAKAQITLG